MKAVEGKVVLLGAQGVGKTSVIGRYVGYKFADMKANMTIGASFFTCKVTVDDVRITLQVWDTAGQERFRSMAPMYYRKANAALLVFDITDCGTFADIKSWVSELRANIEEPMVLAIVGNKCDLVSQRKVASEEAEKYATQIGATYHETSALYNQGVEAAFHSVASGILKLTTGEDVCASLKVYDSSSSGLSCPDMSLTPSSEETLSSSIAYGNQEKPPLCC